MVLLCAMRGSRLRPLRTYHQSRTASCAAQTPRTPSHRDTRPSLPQAAGDITYSIVRPTAFFKSVAGQIKLVQDGKPYVMFGDGGSGGPPWGEGPGRGSLRRVVLHRRPVVPHVLGQWVCGMLWQRGMLGQGWQRWQGRGGGGAPQGRTRWRLTLATGRGQSRATGAGRGGQAGAAAHLPDASRRCMQQP